MTCKDCGHELQIGDYPYCPHGSIYSEHAQRFAPIVVHRTADGVYSFPASVDAVVRGGYDKVEIRTLREADRITREINQHEDAKLGEVQQQSDANRQATRARNQAFMNNLRNKMTPQGRRFLDQARAYQALKDKARENSRPRSANFYIDVFANDSSNREQHRDERTQWRGRKG
jgi:hypothetical protein